MSSNNRPGSDDRPSNDMNRDRRDDRTNRADEHRVDDRTDRTNQGNRDGRTDQGHRDDRADTKRNDGGGGKWLSPLIALLGVWMIVVALVLDVAGTHFWSDVLVGSLLIGVGGYNFSQQANDRVGNSAVALIAVAAGLWLIAAPFVLGADTGLTEAAYDLWFYNHLAVGLLAAGLGALSAYAARDHREDTHQTNV